MTVHILYVQITFQVRKGVPVKCMKSYSGAGYISPHILNLDSIPLQKAFGIHSIGWLRGLHSQSVHIGLQKNVLSLLGFQP